MFLCQLALLLIGFPSTSEKITSFEAHPDYIRAIAVHVSHSVPSQQVRVFRTGGFRPKEVATTCLLPYNGLKACQQNETFVYVD
jgi:hypothetical protein